MPDLQRLKLIVSYDGSGFAGWQSQSRGDTIQDAIERAAAKICGCRIAVHGAGRTDAGVHALGQCAHMDVPAMKLPSHRWPSALNAHLPPKIRIEKMTRVPATFHARFSARGKTYRYRILTTPVLSPFEIGRAWHLRSELESARLEEAGALFLGKHDFAGFAANRGRPAKETVRTIERIEVRSRTGLVRIDVSGDGFLYKMVRLMVGAMVRCALGKEEVENVRRQLRDPTFRGARFVAPAEGLYLLRVRY